MPQCALKIEELLLRAGFPEGVFQTLLIGSREVDRILDDPRVMAATLTGSEGAGVKVGIGAAQADQESRAGTGRQRSLYRDAQRESGRRQSAVGVKARVANNGQSCIAAKRFIVHEQNRGQISERIRRAEMEELKRRRSVRREDGSRAAWPTREALRLSMPTSRSSVEAGAKILTGGKPPQRPGSFYLPTVLTDIPKDSPAYKEELFGPVAAYFA